MKKKVIVFGVGGFFGENEIKFKDQFEIVCYLDNSIDQNQECQLLRGTIPIYNPNLICTLGKYPIIIMVRRFVELFYQMMNLGVDEKRIIFGSFLFSPREKEQLLLEKDQLKIEHKKLIYCDQMGKKIVIKNQQDMDEVLNKLLREKYNKENNVIQALRSMPVKPISRDFGEGRGKPIDRYYIEDFLEEHKGDISGDVLEIADNAYTLKYGKGEKIRSNVLHINGWGNTIKGNLETGEGLEGKQFDTLLITQTLMFTYNLQSTVSNMYKIMKNNAIALITVAGISQISRYDANNWGSYWGFHEDALKKLFTPLFGEENIKVKSYGNVKTATALLYGLCCEELVKEDFEFQDIDYPVILAVWLKKNRHLSNV